MPSLHESILNFVLYQWAFFQGLGGLKSPLGAVLVYGTIFGVLPGYAIGTFAGYSIGISLGTFLGKLAGWILLIAILCIAILLLLGTIINFFKTPGKWIQKLMFILVLVIFGVLVYLYGYFLLCAFKDALMNLGEVLGSSMGSICGASIGGIFGIILGSTSSSITIIIVSNIIGFYIESKNKPTESPTEKSKESVNSPKQD